MKNEDFFYQSIELTENLCSENELRFGSCEAGSLKFKVANIVKDLSGMWLTVSVVLNHHEDDPLIVGRYKVDSDKLTADRMHREIVAYDAMHDIINASAIDWYNTILPEDNSQVTLKEFRTSFVEYFGLQQKEIILVNDDMLVEKTIQVQEGVETGTEEEQTSILRESSLSGKDVITAICEINGCFGHIGRDGKFQYIYLKQDFMGVYPNETLYPDHAPEYLPQAKTGHLYPQEPDSFEIERGCCTSCQYEDFLTGKISKLQIRQEENDIGVIYGEGDNGYAIEDNFLVYGKDSSSLKIIAKNIFEKITNVFYRPFNADIKGNLCLEVGDAVRISTRYEIVESYMLNRVLKGGQAIRDAISSKGVETYSEKVNSVHNSIMQLKGKANILKRTIEETRSELIDSDNHVRSEIVQKADEIKATVSKAVSKYNTVGYDISLFGYEGVDGIKYKANEHKGGYYLNQSDGSLYQSDGTSWVFIKKLDMITENLSSEIKQTAESITSTVARAEKIWSEKEEDDTPIDIGKYGFGIPSIIMTAEEYTPGLKYLDQTSGKVYVAVRHHPMDRPQRVEWEEYRQLEQVSTTLSTEIAQTAEGIRQEVDDTERGLSSRIEQSVKSIDMSVSNGSTSASLNLSVTKENGSVITGQAKEIKFEGLVSFENLAANDGKTIINGDNITTGAINANLITAGTLNGERVNTATLYLKDGLKFSYIDFDGTTKVRKAASLEMVEGQTYPSLIIGGSSSNAGLVCKNFFECRSDADFAKRTYFRSGITVEGGTLDAGNIYMDRGSDNCGIQVSTLASDSGNAYMLFVRKDGLQVDVGLPSSKSYTTTTNLRGNEVKLLSAGSITPSDERLKNSFKPLDEFENVYMDIEPCAFKYNNGTSGRYHFGVKAGNVKTAFEKYGYTTQDFGGFVQMADDPQSENYCGVEDPMGIIYTEFTMWNMQMIQKLYRKLEEQKTEIDLLKKTVSMILERTEKDE